MRIHILCCELCEVRRVSVARYLCTLVFQVPGQPMTRTSGSFPMVGPFCLAVIEGESADALPRPEPELRRDLASFY